MEFQHFNSKEISESSPFPSAVFNTEGYFLLGNLQFLKIFNIQSPFKTRNISNFFHMNAQQKKRLEKLELMDSWTTTLVAKITPNEHAPFLVTAQKFTLDQRDLGIYLEMIPDSLLCPMDSSQEKDGWDCKTGQQISLISHEISNPLALLQIQCDHLTHLLEKEGEKWPCELKRSLASILRASHRISEKNRELRTLARKLINRSHGDP